MPTNPSSNVTDLLSLRGKVVLITGAAGHLGLAMADALAEAGASVIVSSRETSRAKDVASRLDRVGDARHFSITLDHMDESSIESGFGQAVRQAGRIDVLLTDVAMPGMSGIELATTLAQTQSDMRVIVMSGHPPNLVSLPKLHRPVECSIDEIEHDKIEYNANNSAEPVFRRAMPACAVADRDLGHTRPLP